MSVTLGGVGVAFATLMGNKPPENLGKFYEPLPVSVEQSRADTRQTIALARIRILRASKNRDSAPKDVSRYIDDLEDAWGYRLFYARDRHQPIRFTIHRREQDRRSGTEDDIIAIGNVVTNVDDPSIIDPVAAAELPLLGDPGRPDRTHPPLLPEKPYYVSLNQEKSAYISLADSNHLATLDKSFTAEAWVQMDFTDGPLLFSHVSRPMGISGWHIVPFGSDMKLEYEGHDISGSSDRLAVPRDRDTAMLPIHIAICNEPSGMRMFVNGRVTGLHRSEDFARISRIEGPFVIGENPTWHRSIDNLLGIYAFRFSSSARYQGTFDPPQTFDKDEDTVVLLDFTRPSRYRIEDLSGNGHHGRLIGGEWCDAETRRGVEVPWRVPEDDYRHAWKKRPNSYLYRRIYQGWVSGGTAPMEYRELRRTELYVDLEPVDISKNWVTPIRLTPTFRASGRNPSNSDKESGGWESVDE
jgi:hypothetical protein